MIGETVGAYNIVSELGRGGMGVVYLAEHRHMGRRAAIKVLMPELSERGERLQRFFLEARAASLLEHPGIIRVFDCNVHPNGSAYIIMEYLAGQNLQAFLAARHKLLPAEAAAIVLRVCDALAAAHEKGIVHRDLKPDNVFVLSYPPGGIKVLDFGVAKLSVTLQNAPSRTQSGALVGTPLYMSPEQARGSTLVDARADIYSLGCILFELLTGQPPFVQTSAGELLAAHLNQMPPPLDPALPAPLRVLIEGMLAKDPQDRPSLREEVIPLLQAVTTGQSAFERIGAVTMAVPAGAHAAAPESFVSAPLVTTPTERPARRPGRLLGGLVLLGALTGAGVWWQPWTRLPALMGWDSPAAPAVPPPREPITTTPLVAAERSALDGPETAAPGSSPAAKAGTSYAAAANRRAGAARPHRRVPSKAAPARRGTATGARLAAVDGPASPLTVSLSSEPPGAVVCAPNSRARVGFTNGPVALKGNGKEKTTFVLYRAGYHLERITVADARTPTVKLRPLTDDDLAPLPPCR